MFKIEELVSIAIDSLEAESECQKYNRQVRMERGMSPNSSLRIPSLNGSDGYQLGVVSECRDRSRYILINICNMLEIDYKRLIATVKSMRRKECHNGRGDNPCLTRFIEQRDKEKLYKFLQAKADEG